MNIAGTVPRTPGASRRRRRASLAAPATSIPSPRLRVCTEPRRQRSVFCVHLVFSASGGPNLQGSRLVSRSPVRISQCFKFDHPKACLVRHTHMLNELSWMYHYLYLFPFMHHLTPHPCRLYPTSSAPACNNVCIRIRVLLVRLNGVCYNHTSHHLRRSVSRLQIVQRVTPGARHQTCF